MCGTKIFSCEKIMSHIRPHKVKIKSSSTVFQMEYLPYLKLSTLGNGDYGRNWGRLNLNEMSLNYTNATIEVIQEGIKGLGILCSESA